MGCFHRASLRSFYVRRLPPLLDSLLRFLLCNLPTPSFATTLQAKADTSSQIQVYATEKLGFDETTSVNLLIITNAAGLPARMPCGYLADRYLGPLNVLIPWVFLCGLLMFCWAAVHNTAGLYVFAIFYGVASAAAMGLFAGTVPSLTKDISKIGTRVGMILTLMSLGPLTGPSVAGALIARTGGGYLAPQIWAGAALLLGAGSLVAARVWTSGWHLKVKL
jgi:MFS family permease